MTLRLRFLLSLLALLALMSLPALFAADRVTTLRDVVLELRGQGAQAGLAAGRLQAAVARLGHYQRLYVAAPDGVLAEQMHDALTEVASQLDVLRTSGYADVVRETGLEAHQLAAVTGRISALVESGQLNSATEYLHDMATPLVQQAYDAVPVLAAAIDAKTNAGVATAQRSAEAAGTATLLALIGAIVLAFMLAIGASSALTRPIDRLRLAMAEVAEGSFEAPPELPYNRTDELGHLSRSFRTMTLRLAELDRLKAEFVGTASHDLKTPISIINGYAELMQEELDESLQHRHREVLRSLAEQTRTLQRRVDQLLEISRMEAGRLRLGLEEMDARHFIAELHRAFEPAARMHDVRFELEIHPQTPPTLVADPDVLRTDVLGNLIGNALKFTPAGGTIRLAIRPEGDHVAMEVADTGPGIPPEQINRIFEKYYQGRGSGGGAGLGLAIARAAVEAHGGRIEVRSQVGRGSRFRVLIPAAISAAVAAHA
ncbi:MAG TPA: HAMP domain-containing sensor histidine kinase [Longimicrobiales bacterium]|nr:HAMP domain-containing sensor histidine kinase [Longimicrobiales bacterium]